ncbi:hypothetical protein C8F04DRAFT_1200375 [Mycena alexandri]|uniref:Uncharacterized protein n=1 Tax=Mycena alexandri TaxID=1745969 RepID=A0AAD6RXZ1_9AGAR|nr:hypothetical protein C8F04DRAFT_1200375 [Mycena alexandri]
MLWAWRKFCFHRHGHCPQHLACHTACLHHPPATSNAVQNATTTAAHATKTARAVSDALAHAQENARAANQTLHTLRIQADPSPHAGHDARRTGFAACLPTGRGRGGGMAGSNGSPRAKVAASSAAAAASAAALLPLNEDNGLIGRMSTGAPSRRRAAERERKRHEREAAERAVKIERDADGVKLEPGAKRELSAPASPPHRVRARPHTPKSPHPPESGVPLYDPNSSEEEVRDVQMHLSGISPSPPRFTGSPPPPPPSSVAPSVATREARQRIAASVSAPRPGFGSTPANSPARNLANSISTHRNPTNSVSTHPLLDLRHPPSAPPRSMAPPHRNPTSAPLNRQVEVFFVSERGGAVFTNVDWANASAWGWGVIAGAYSRRATIPPHSGLEVSRHRQQRARTLSGAWEALENGGRYGMVVVQGSQQEVAEEVSRLTGERLLGDDDLYMS